MCVCVCECVSPSACLPVCLSVCPSVRLSVCPSVRPSVRLSVCPSVCMYIFTCVYMYTNTHTYTPRHSCVCVHVRMLARTCARYMRVRTRIHVQHRSFHGSASSKTFTTKSCEPIGSGSCVLGQAIQQAQDVTQHPVTMGPTPDAENLKIKTRLCRSNLHTCGTI